MREPRKRWGDRGGAGGEGGRSVAAKEGWGWFTPELRVPSVLQGFLMTCPLWSVQRGRHFFENHINTRGRAILEVLWKLTTFCCSSLFSSPGAPLPKPCPSNASSDPKTPRFRSSSMPLFGRGKARYCCLFFCADLNVEFPAALRAPPTNTSLYQDFYHGLTPKNISPLSCLERTCLNYEDSFSYHGLS